MVTLKLYHFPQTSTISELSYVPFPHCCNHFISSYACSATYLSAIHDLLLWKSKSTKICFKKNKYFPFESTQHLLLMAHSCLGKYVIPEEHQCTSIFWLKHSTFKATVLFFFPLNELPSSYFFLCSCWGGKNGSLLKCASFFSSHWTKAIKKNNSCVEL